MDETLAGCGQRSSELARRERDEQIVFLAVKSDECELKDALKSPTRKTGMFLRFLILDRLSKISSQISAMAVAEAVGRYTLTTMTFWDAPCGERDRM